MVTPCIAGRAAVAWLEEKPQGDDLLPGGLQPRILGAGRPCLLTRQGALGWGVARSLTIAKGTPSRWTVDSSGASGKKSGLTVAQLHPTISTGRNFSFVAISESSSRRRSSRAKGIALASGPVTAISADAGA